MVFVCTGNICRSPMAAGFARLEAESRRLGVEIDSAGTGALENSSASRNAVLVMRERDVDVTAHRARQLMENEGDQFTLFVVMTAQHALWLKRIAGIPPERITILGSGVPDPYGGDADVYRRTRDILEMEVRELFDRLGGQMRQAAERSQAPDCEPDIAPVVTTMTESDLADVADMEEKCFSDPWSKNAIAESIANPNAAMMVALFDGVVCGYVCIMTAADSAYVPKLCVRPAYRRRGIATALMAAAERISIAEGCEEITLEVRESNHAAIALYESMGFEPVGRRPGFYTQPIETAVIMTKLLGAEDAGE